MTGEEILKSYARYLEETICEDPANGCGRIGVGNMSSLKMSKLSPNHP